MLPAGPEVQLKNDEKVYDPISDPFFNTCGLPPKTGAVSGHIIALYIQCINVIHFR